MAALREEPKGGAILLALSRTLSFAASSVLGCVSLEVLNVGVCPAPSVTHYCLCRRIRNLTPCAFNNEDAADLPACFENFGKENLENL